MTEKSPAGGGPLCVRYVLRRLLQAIPVFFGTTFLIYFMVFAMPGDPILALFGEQHAKPGGRRAVARAVPPGPALPLAVLPVHEGLAHRESRCDVLGPKRELDACPSLPCHTSVSFSWPLSIEFLLSVVIGSHRWPSSGQVLRPLESALRSGPQLVPVFVAMFLGQYFIGSSSAGLRRRSGRTSRTGRDVPTRARHRSHDLRHRYATHARLGDRVARSRLRAHGIREGPHDATHHPRAHRAQLAHPGHHEHGGKFRGSDSRAPP